MSTEFSMEALEGAIANHGVPQIFNSAQTSQAFTDVLIGHRIKNSMDGKGRWIDNDFVE